ncbi:MULTISPECIES: ABC transporter ATP-binding protein [unclassified Rhizobium]|uniref:ABC transporter ATP-binding protein n=1 Tax=unclassified Rhizobium TaxID=2613769 RepID=UPI001ADC20FE|nr:MULTISPECIES: ATP-binding cassette domain-containing protein [unclassified Rhizobium]MBO9101672.1 ATP-binding cassette domain-containing protein [Rhizobium sp. L58/93]MBO9187728.1 ATP-binding cassette domain-containing protein [Rhizobium sp. E27B/91]QXZ86379.1 ATP-binding cassette domain-containing protein [Rhizobium sp. K1/93]QXZ92166.1 ATP-binding cassette domain-containing protein [Rhizobium sp. K15/93]
MIGVQIDNLNRHFGKLTVLRNISMQVNPGEFTVLLGPSGCGKSTLLASIAGLDELQGGKILFDGTDVSDMEPSERNIGMVFQSYALYPTMTVRQNLSFGLEVARTSKAEIVERVLWAAQLLQIEPLLDRKPSQLSGGQRQRVAIGRALVRKTNLFLFDEPLSNLDAKLRTEMRVEIKELHKRLGATFVYVTHDQVEAMTLASRIAIMHGGKIEQYASPEEVYERPASLFVAGFIGSPPMNLLPATLKSRSDGFDALAGDQVLSVDGYAFTVTPSDGQPVLLGVRPENVVIGGLGGMATLDAQIVVIEPLGSDTLVWVDCAGKRMAVRVPPKDAKGLSGGIRLGFSIDNLSIFSQESELRL